MKLKNINIPKLCLDNKKVTTAAILQVIEVVRIGLSLAVARPSLPLGEVTP